MQTPPRIVSLCHLPSKFFPRLIWLILEVYPPRVYVWLHRLDYFVFHLFAPNAKKAKNLDLFIKLHTQYRNKVNNKDNIGRHISIVVTLKKLKSKYIGIKYSSIIACKTYIPKVVSPTLIIIDNIFPVDNITEKLLNIAKLE